MLRRSALLVFLLAACSKSTHDDSPKTPDASVEGGSVVVNEHQLGAGDVELFVRRRGPQNADQTVVLIHGGPALSSRYMRPLEALADPQRAVVSFDQRGAGASSKPEPPNFSMDAYVADLEAVRADSGADRVVLLAHSWGGLIAWAYIQKHPDRVSGLILVGALAPTKPPNDEARTRLLAKITKLQTEGRIPDPLPPPVGDDCMPGVLAVTPAYFHDPAHAVSEDLKQTTCSQSASNATNEAVFFPGYDYSAALQFSGRVHIIFGESDPLGVELGKHMQGALQKAATSFDVLPGAGHSPWFEKPEAMRDSVLLFLAPPKR